MFRAGWENEDTPNCLLTVFGGNSRSTPFLIRSVSHNWSPLLADNSPGCTCLVEGKFQGKSLFSSDSVIFHTGFYPLWFSVYSFLPSLPVNPFKSHPCRNTWKTGFEHHASVSLVETPKYLFKECAASWQTFCQWLPF